MAYHNLHDHHNNARIERLVERADDLLREAESFAQYHSIPFRFSLSADIGESALQEEGRWS